MTFISPISLFLAVLIAVAIFVIAWIRRPALPRISLALASCGVVLMALSAGGISCRRGAAGRIAVMVDCSPSTRGASFRDARWLQARLRELLGSREFDLHTFADTTGTLDEGQPLKEIASGRTVFLPPAQARAVVLFSDGRFDAPPATPPVYAVVDPGLDRPTDAAVVELEERGTQLAASVRNTGAPRTLHWVDRQRRPATAPTGSTVLTARLVTTTETITARLASGDAWPENDALSIRPSPPMASQRWWVGDAPLRGWMGFSPSNLPLESAAWLGPAIIVLNNVSADAISPQQQDRLQQYVRDLGGALVIAGGDRAFAAGHYTAGQLEVLSPLASTPPEPVNHWVLLLDASGSMSASTPTGSRFKVAADAMIAVMRDLPDADLLSIGSFSRQLRWWSLARSVQDTALQTLPPPDVQPEGPTNLQSALQQMVTALPDSLPVNLLVISDAEAEISDAESLATALREKRIRVHGISVGDGNRASKLQQIVQITGGQFRLQTDAHGWAQDVREMLRAQMPHRFIDAPSAVTFKDALAELPARTVSGMNRTWLKRTATLLATATRDGEQMPAAARWRVGAGEVVSLAFPPSADEIGGIERRIARRPRDPRFSVHWRAGSTLSVRIDARDPLSFLNEQSLRLEFNGGNGQPIPQTGPGRYELELPAPRSPTTVTILHDGRVLDRFAVAGRYPHEFQQIGNDIDALRALSVRSGGKLIEPSTRRLIDFPETRPLRSFAGLFAILAVVMFAAALVWWRLS